MKDYFFEERGIAYRTNDLVPGRKTLVFLHGLSGSLSAWKEYEEQYESSCNVITLDLRGHGESKRPATLIEYEIKEFSQDVIFLLKFLSIDSCILIGHSYGTLVCLELMLKVPHKISHTILIAPIFGIEGSLMYRLTYLCAYIVSKIASLLHLRSRQSGRIDYSKYSHGGDWYIPRMLADFRNTGATVYAYCFVQLFAHDFDAVWRRVQAPCTIIHGTNDSYVPVAHARELSLVLHDAPRIEIDGADHVLVINDTERLLNALDKVFLTV